MRHYRDALLSGHVVDVHEHNRARCPLWVRNAPARTSCIFGLHAVDLRPSGGDGDGIGLWSLHVRAEEKPLQLLERTQATGFFPSTEHKFCTVEIEQRLYELRL